MPHDEHCGCGCGHDHHVISPAGVHDAAEVTEAQKDFLHQLGHHGYFPVAQFAVKDSRQESFYAIALAPVFLRSAADDMGTVKGIGAFLRQMETMGLITLDYDMPLDGYDYEEYKTSALYQYFCETVAEGASKPNFQGNTPVLELGSIALTEAGVQIASVHCGHGHHHHHG